MENWNESSFKNDKKGFNLVGTKTNLMLDFGIYRKIGTRFYSLFYSAFRIKEIELLKADSKWTKEEVFNFIPSFCTGFDECMKISDFSPSKKC